VGDVIQWKAELKNNNSQRIEFQNENNKLKKNELKEKEG